MNLPANRRHDRIPFFEHVTIHKPVMALTRAVDISMGGIRLRASLSLAPETEIAFEMFKGQASFVGKVLWCQGMGSGFVLGANFVDADWSLLAQIQHLELSKSV